MPRPGAGEALPAEEIVPAEALHFGRPRRVMNLCRVGQEGQIPPSANGEALRSNEKGGSASFLSPFSQAKRFLPKDGL